MHEWKCILWGGSYVTIPYCYNNIYFRYIKNKTKACKTNSIGTGARLKSKLCYTLSIDYESVAQDVFYSIIRLNALSI